MVKKCPVIDWNKDSGIIVKFYPECFDEKMFNWKDFSLHVLEYCPEKFNPNLFNWNDNSIPLVITNPNLIYNNLLNWKSIDSYNFSLIWYLLVQGIKLKSLNDIIKDEDDENE